MGKRARLKKFFESGGLRREPEPRAFFTLRIRAEKFAQCPFSYQGVIQLRMSFSSIHFKINLFGSWQRQSDGIH